MKKYDYVIAGAGCAGLSLVMRMIESGGFRDKQILLIEKALKNTNDRTWCFWEQGAGFFEPMVLKKWNQIWFYGKEFSRKYDIAPYQYKMIRGVDFYNYCFDSIKQQSNIDLQFGSLTEIRASETGVLLTIDGQSQNFGNAIVFNSIWKEQDINRPHTNYLLQHFKGWVVESTRPLFNIDEAILMDFRVAQTHGTTFVYLMPITTTRALVEYTLFSKSLLNESEYDTQLENYLQRWLKPGEYEVVEKEFGVIPMTDAPFPWYDNGAFHIGTAGGQTKASSGYTFQFIQRETAAIAECILDNCLSTFHRPRQYPSRFHFYDSVLLRILAGHQVSGELVFTNLFQKNHSASIFRFLDNETSLREDIKIISSLPTIAFSKAAIKQLFS